MFDENLSNEHRRCKCLQFIPLNIPSKLLPLQKPLQCAPKGYDGFDLTTTWSCFNGTNAAQGVELLKAYGDQTNTIDLSFVPSIEIDNVSLCRICVSTRLMNVKRHQSFNRSFCFFDEDFNKF